MTIGICTFIRADRILKCPECNLEFNVSDIEEDPIKIQAGKYIYTLAECPCVGCHEIVAIDVQEVK